MTNKSVDLSEANVLNYGVIGVGMMGQEHLHNIAHLPGAKVTAVTDPHLPSRQAAQEICPDAVVFEDLDQLLSSDLCQALVLATPNFTHAPILEKVLATELAVLVEKPLTTTIADAQRVVELSRQRQALIWVGLEYRYMPAVASLIAETQLGTVGKVQMVSIREHRFPFLPKVGDWNRFRENTGGTMVEKCCHFFDLMCHIVGTQPTRVFASGSQAVNHLEESYNGRRPDIFDNAYVLVEFDGGERGIVDLCMFAEATEHQEEVVAVGDRGKLEALIPPNLLRIGRRGEHWIGDTEKLACEDPRIRYQGVHHGSSYLEHLEFREAVLSGSAAKVSVEEGMLAVALGVAAQESMSRGVPVEVAEVLAAGFQPSTY